jgi:hypothetical protein
VVVTVQADGSVVRERHVLAVSRVHDLTVSLDGAAHEAEVHGAVSAALAGLDGCVRVTLEGEIGPSARVDARDLARLGDHLDGLVVRIGQLGVACDLDAIQAEPTVRGQFVRDAVEAIEDPDLRRRVVLTGLRALEGRADLEVA